MNFIIKNQIKKQLMPLKQNGLKVKMSKLKGNDVVIATNYPSNYQAVFMETMNALESFGVVISTGKTKNEPCLIFKNLPKDFIGTIRQVISEVWG